MEVGVRARVRARERAAGARGAARVGMLIGLDLSASSAAHQASSAAHQSAIGVASRRIMGASTLVGGIVRRTCSQISTARL